MERQSTIAVAVSAFVGLMLLGASSQSALAAVTFDPETGEGFAGKGDVQAAFGWNNKQLQENAENVEFRVFSSEESTWDCSRSHPSQEGQEIIQTRSRTTTFDGVFQSEARMKNQVAGFYLLGYGGNATSETEGPAFESCPSGPWSLVEGSTQTNQIGGGGLQLTSSLP